VGGENLGGEEGAEEKERGEQNRQIHSCLRGVIEGEGGGERVF